MCLCVRVSVFVCLFEVGLRVSMWESVCENFVNIVNGNMLCKTVWKRYLSFASIHIPSAKILNNLDGKFLCLYPVVHFLVTLWCNLSYFQASYGKLNITIHTKILWLGLDYRKISVLIWLSFLKFLYRGCLS